MEDTSFITDQSQGAEENLEAFNFQTHPYDFLFCRKDTIIYEKILKKSVRLIERILNKTTSWYLELV